MCCRMRHCVVWRQAPMFQSKLLLPSSFTLKTENADSSKTKISMNQTIRHHICDQSSHDYENFKSLTSSSNYSLLQKVLVPTYIKIGRKNSFFKQEVHHISECQNWKRKHHSPKHVLFI